MKSYFLMGFTSSYRVSPRILSRFSFCWKILLSFLVPNLMASLPILYAAKENFAVEDEGHSQWVKELTEILGSSPCFLFVCL